MLLKFTSTLLTLNEGWRFARNLPLDRRFTRCLYEKRRVEYQTELLHTKTYYFRIETFL